MNGLHLNITRSKKSAPGQFTIALADGSGHVGYAETLEGAIQSLPSLVQSQLQHLPMFEFWEAERCARDAMPYNFPECI